jgi:hypothetical protein
MDQHQDVAQLKDIKCSPSEILGAVSAGFIARLRVFELWNYRPQKKSQTQFNFQKPTIIFDRLEIKHITCIVKYYAALETPNMVLSSGK